VTKSETSGPRAGGYPPPRAGSFSRSHPYGACGQSDRFWLVYIKDQEPSATARSGAARGRGEGEGGGWMRDRGNGARVTVVLVVGVYVLRAFRLFLRRD